jgi:hypothetical protein
MMMATTPNIPRPTRSMMRRSGFPVSPRNDSAKANSSEKNRTCRISPSAKAPTTEAGMMCVT